MRWQRAACNWLGERAAPWEGFDAWRETAAEFLATKLVPPRCEGLIPRPRLLDMVSQLSGKRLATIKAPAGFGKTSLAVTGRKNFNRAEMPSGG